MLGSTSSCGRATPVNASMAQPAGDPPRTVVALEQRRNVPRGAGQPRAVEADGLVVVGHADLRGPARDASASRRSSSSGAVVLQPRSWPDLPVPWYSLEPVTTSPRSAGDHGGATTRRRRGPGGRPRSRPASGLELGQRVGVQHGPAVTSPRGGRAPRPLRLSATIIKHLLERHGVPLDVGQAPCTTGAVERLVTAVHHPPPGPGRRRCAAGRPRRSLRDSRAHVGLVEVDSRPRAVAARDLEGSAGRGRRGPVEGPRPGAGTSGRAGRRAGARRDGRAAGDLEARTSMMPTSSAAGRPPPSRKSRRGRSARRRPTPRAAAARTRSPGCRCRRRPRSGCGGRSARRSAVPLQQDRGLPLEAQPRDRGDVEAEEPSLGRGD